MSLEDDLQPSESAEDRRERLVKLLLARRLADEAMDEVIQPRPTDRSEAPLSFAQERLWFIDQMGLAGSAYNMVGGLWLQGRLDLKALSASLDELVRRHETLRTSFREEGGQGLQVVRPAGPRPLEVEDHVGAAPEAALAQAMQEETRYAFDLVTDALFRIRLLRFSAERHALIATIHHIAADGWSMDVLVRDLSVLYATLSMGKPSPLPPLPIQYADFALWQRGSLQRERLNEQAAYWRRQLIDLPDSLELPYDRARPATASHRGSTVPFTIGGDVAEALQKIARETGATSYMVLLSVFALVLSRFSGQTDLVIGSPIAGRARPETQDLIGFFVNMLALRVKLEGRPSFRDLVGAVRQVCLQGYANQDVPFERVVHEVRPRRELGRHPLFQVTFALQNKAERHESTTKGEGIVLTPVAASSVTAKFDLSVSVIETATDLAGYFEYATDLFDAETVQRLASAFTQVAGLVAANPDQSVAQLDVLDAHAKLLAAAESATRVPETRSTIPDAISAWARTHPEAEAVVAGASKLTFGELERAAAALASRLGRMGVGRDSIVAIALPRSVGLAVAILGIWKAGAAYLPLDLDYPAERLSFMARDARIVGVITNPAADSLFAGCGVPTIDLSCLEAEVADPLRSAPAGDLAYVIYTSGSTGMPKGVMVRHEGLSNLLEGMRAELGVLPPTTFTMNAPIVFDGSVIQLIRLAEGHRIVIPDEVERRDPSALAALIRTHDVRVVDAVPSLLGRIIAEDPGVLEGRILWSGGEALSRSLRDEVLRLDGVALHNLYGPTECSAVSTGGLMRADDKDPSIGRPLANTSAYVLDVGLEPCPIGVAGELYVSGVGLARGYLGRPGLTSSRFVADPFGPAGTRMYRTGDRARWRSDGELEFLGRVDDQVKIRGFRIEPGEIEARLLSHVGVREAAVIAREDRPGEKRLVAYVAPDLAALRSSQEADAEAVAQWETLYDDTYEQMGEGPSFVGWNSSYTGEPIPEPEMAHWLSSTLERITALQPRRVLEVGCGAGLFLQHLAPGCETYVATDVSGQVVAELKRWIGGRPELSHVELMRREARDFAGIESGDFDTVVLNSVIQYFPGVDYLLEVLQGAVARVGSGGKVFVGDVRHLGLLGAFQAAVQLSRASPEADAAQLWALAERARAEEQELLVDPGFFLALKARWPQIGAVEILLKRGEADNELTRHRYDVVLHVGPVAEVPTADGLELEGEDIDLERLADLLKREQPPVVWLRGLVNRRLASDLAAWRALRDARPGDLAQQAADVCARADEGVEPETFWALAEAHGYQAHIGYDPRSGGERFDVRLTHQTVTLDLKTLSGPAPDTAEPWGRYANAPQDVGLKIKLAADLREHMRQVLPEHMIPQALVLLEALPLNTNGKLDRRALPQPEGRPPGLAYVAPRTPTEKTLAAIWQDVLGLDRVGANDNFFELGGDSIQCIQVAARARREGVLLHARQLFEHQTLVELAVSAGLGVQIDAEQGPVSGQIHQTPIASWFFEAHDEDHHHFNQAFLFDVDEALAPAEVQSVFRQLVEHHDMLRVRAEPIGDRLWRQWIEPDCNVQVEHLDLSDVEDQALGDAITQACSQIQSRLHLTLGPIFRVAVLEPRRGRPTKLFIAIHHLAVDMVSWRVLIEDFNVLLMAQRKGVQSAPPPKTTSFKAWSEKLRAHADGLDLEQEMAHWRVQPWKEVVELPRDSVCASDLSPSALEHVVDWDERDTESLLRDLPSAFGCRASDVLVFSLCRSLGDWARGEVTLLSLEGHGREEIFEDVDLSRTIGWFTTLHPAVIDLRGSSQLLDGLASAKRQLVAASSRGMAYGVLRYMTDSGDELRRLPAPEVSFNYLGQFRSGGGDSAGFRRSALSTGALSSAKHRRPHLLDVSAAVDEGRLRTRWTYDPSVHSAATIEALAQAQGKVLSALLDLARSRLEVSTKLSPVSQTVRAKDGVSLHVRTWGEGRPVLLVHGFRTDAQAQWFDTGVAERLVAAGHRIIAPDLRGHGESGLGDRADRWPPGLLADDLAEIVSAFDLTSFDLVGYSLGAQIALRAAADGLAPQRMILGGVGDTAILESRAQRERFLAITGRLNGLSSSHDAFAYADDPDVMSKLLAAAGDTLASHIDCIVMPILVVSGLEDEHQGSPTALAGLFSQAVCRRLPGGHIDLPGRLEFREALVEFLSDRPV